MTKIFRSRVAAISLLFLTLGIVSAQDGPETVIRGTKEFQKRVVISGLASPWEITWGPDNMLWVTERTGKTISRVDPVSGKKQVAAVIAEVSAPGGQDGLLGMALHPDLLQNRGNDFVYVYYTYVDSKLPPVRFFPDPASPYHQLYGKVVRFTYDKAQGTLSKPLTLLTGLPAGNDHDAGRIKVGPDRKLYLTVGDEGHDQLGNFCMPIESQRLPTLEEMQRKDFSSYVGKSLRLNLDGSIPADNPNLKGVVSHVYTYGHRNPQGIDFGPDGTLYSSEQGPKTDDEINILVKGKNYGWPHVAGKLDNKAYEYARWADATTPCSQLKFSDIVIHPSVPRAAESDFKEPFVEPIATMFTVPTGYNFQDKACRGVDFICWPTVGASSIEYYASKGKGIPGWDKVLLVTTLKRGSLYVLPLTPDGKAKAGYFSRYFQSNNRFRDTAINPDLKTIYVATDPGGLAEAVEGGTTTKMENPGAILAFTYLSEGSGKTMSSLSKVGPAASPEVSVTMVSGAAPEFTAEQAAAGKTAFNANCAVCHGNTMTNGTFAPPLAGEYFKGKWAGKTVKAFYDHSRTMPPAAPKSLPEETYVNIVAYVLETNGVKASAAKLPVSAEQQSLLTIR